MLDIPPAVAQATQRKSKAAEAPRLANLNSQLLVLQQLCEVVREWQAGRQLEGRMDGGREAGKAEIEYVCMCGWRGTGAFIASSSACYAWEIRSPVAPSKAHFCTL